MQHVSTVPVHVLADWQVFGADDTQEYLTGLLDRAVENDILDSFDIYLVDGSGPFGLTYVFFGVTLELAPVDIDAPKILVKNLLDEIVGDKDVSVRWITRQMTRQIIDVELEPVEEENPNAVEDIKGFSYGMTLESLVEYIKERPGQSRATIEDDWLESGYDSSFLTNMLAKGRRAGLLASKGRSKAARWYAVDGG